MMFKVERKKDEQKDTLSNGDKKRIKEKQRKTKGDILGGNKKQKVLEPLGPLFSLILLVCF